MSIGCLPDSSTDRSVVDMARDPTFVKRDDLQSDGMSAQFRGGRAEILCGP